MGREKQVRGHFLFVIRKMGTNSVLKITSLTFTFQQRSFHLKSWFICDNSDKKKRKCAAWAAAAAAHYGLQLGSWQHELHLLSQHGCCGLLLDQVVPPVDLQLGLQVRRRVEVFAVVTGAASLWRREVPLRTPQTTQQAG